MEPKNDAAEKTVAVPDGFFAAEAAKADADTGPSGAIPPESPIGDYTRELQQEYDEQQEEGKL